MHSKNLFLRWGRQPQQSKHPLSIRDKKLLLRRQNEPTELEKLNIFKKKFLKLLNIVVYLYGFDTVKINTTRLRYLPLKLN